MSTFGEAVTSAIKAHHQPTSNNVSWYCCYAARARAALFPPYAELGESIMHTRYQGAWWTASCIPAWYRECEFRMMTAVVCSLAIPPHHSCICFMRLGPKRVWRKSY